jgi:hypothetical protein
VVPVATVLRMVLGAALRGNFSVVRAFFAAGKRGERAAQARKEAYAALEALPS